mgnify:CR=1 FL=1|tara:strand:+ start:396 stop:1061 length:666 start_codon:yes stop_codon:yes gene_type:complete
MIKKIFTLEKKLNFKIKDKNLLVIAMTHKSANIHSNNEKLEFLGDRVIGLILSKKLLDLYPSESEGVLDKKFAKLVNRETCSSIAYSIGLHNYIIIGNKKKINKEDHKILSDACEALIGAVFVDKGYEYTSKLVLNFWKNEISKSQIVVLDSKTKLQEYSLKNFKQLPEYKLISVKGPKHNPSFKISVAIKGSKQHTGIGFSKQQAQLSAAKNLLTKMKII